MASGLAAASLEPYLRRCGYRDALLRPNFRFGDDTVATWAAFAHEPADARSACIAALDCADDRKAEGLVASMRPLGAPVVLVCTGGQLQWWKQGHAGPSLLITYPATDVPRFFAENRKELAPEAVYRAKTWGAFRQEYQRDFVDIGLMPLVDREIGERLTGLIERVISRLRGRLWPKKDNSDEQGAWLLKSVFWLVAAEILHDKEVRGFASLDLHDVDVVLAAVAKHYGARHPLGVSSAAEREALVYAAQQITQYAHLGHVTTESLAYVYENALISKETRQELGTHSTPQYLVDYIVWQLAPWVEALPADQRHVFEPSCGHAAFLVSALRLLKDLLPPSLESPSARRRYLRRSLHGVDKDDFALELALLSLTLADIPNPNGWNLQSCDMFKAGVLEFGAARAGVFLANPPFGRFTRQDRDRSASQGIQLECLTKPAEMLRRTLPHLRPGACFGVVVPQGFLHSKEATDVRRLLSERFEIREVCLFPDNIFQFSDHESAVLIGRRLSDRQTPRGSLRYCRVREHDVESFKRSLRVTTERQVPQSRFAADKGWDMRIPDLEEVWAWLATAPRMSSVACVAQGLTYRGKDLPVGSLTVSDQHFLGGVRGFAKWDTSIQIHDQPQEVWMSLDPAVIQRSRSGTTTGVPQVLLNYHPVSRGPWRLKAIIDRTGHAVTSSFLTVRPRAADLTLDFLWGLCNSPIASAYAYSYLLKRNTQAGTMRQMPLPTITVDGHQRVEEAVRGYLDAAAPSQFGLGPPAGDAHLRRLLLQVDAEVLRLYGLPPLLERQLLDTFAGSRRPGVPFVFERYYPEDFEPCIPLHEYLSNEHARSAASESRKQHRAGAPGDSVADEAAQFMAAKGLGRAYDRFRALVGNAFQSLRSLATTLEIDPDAPHLRTIRLHAVVPGTIDDALASKDAFDEALAREEDRRLSFFVLTMEAVE